MNPWFSPLRRLFSVIGVVASLSTVVGGQGRPALSSALSSVTKRMPWGHPDLQGLWTNTTTTPLERPAALANKPTLTDAERAEFDAQPPPKQYVGEVWFERGKRTNQTSLIVDPPNGRLPPFTAVGEAHQKMRTAIRVEGGGRPPDSYEDFDAYNRCITRGMPGAMMPGFYNHNYQIVQTPEYVAISIEMIHDVRIIPLDGRPHVSPRVQQWLGDSRGRWEGDTLVVETTNFKEGAEQRTGGSPEMVLVERFHRIDADTIDYKFTVTDTTVFTAPWTASAPMSRLTEGQIYEYACHEGNYALPNILRAARSQERNGSKEAGSGPQK